MEPSRPQRRNRKPPKRYLEGDVAESVSPSTSRQRSTTTGTTTTSAVTTTMTSTTSTSHAAASLATTPASASLSRSTTKSKRKLDGGKTDQAKKAKEKASKKAKQDQTKKKGKKKMQKSSTVSTATRARPSTSRKKQAGTGPKVGKGQGMTDAEVQAMLKNTEERDQHVDDLVADLSEEEAKGLLAKICKGNPCYVFDLMAVHEVQGPARPPPPSPDPDAQPHWCVCGNCRIMSEILEDECCNQTPENCRSRTPEMQGLCLDEQVLHLSMLYRGDVLGIRNVQGQNPRERKKSFRFSGYRQYTLWQHGRLGYGVRRVIPSCCVWRIRDTYPDASGQYVPYRPGLF